jgi:O-antigen/teichoic acid export membrane protein
MATAGQRYFSFELGRGDYEQLKKIFSLSLIIYVLIAAVVLILSETIGLWFVSNKLVIPIERKDTALWVYQFSVISFIFTILTGPYMAMIIAHEDMKIYAYISIVEVLLRLGTVFILRFILWDKLILYGILMLIVTVINTSVYRFISNKKYPECRFSFYWNKDLFKEIASYSGWNLFGASVGVFKNQITNILLNQFFNPIVVAARSIATMTEHATTSFSQNFNTAMRPQIIKSYAADKKEEMILLMFRGSKGTYLLVYVFVLPLVLEMPMILTLWLKNPPEYTVLFTRLALFDVLIHSISYPLMTAAQATGKIKLYQSVVGGILLLNVPVSWIILFMGAPAYSIMIVSIILTFIAYIVRLFILKRLINYSIWQYFKTVYKPVCLISLVSAIIPAICFYFLAQNILRLCLVIFFSVISVGIHSYFIALNKDERRKVRSVISQYCFNEN